MKDLMKISTLLQEAAPKVREYQAKRKEKRRMGHDFNIFSIMGMEKKEVKTHSAMIAELLNPNGSHGQGDTFLNNFLESISECNVLSKEGKKKESIATWKLRNPVANDTVIVMKEKSYPNKSKNTDEKDVDNRVDIVIEFENLIMLIENKIDAADQQEQLKRYSEVGQDSGKGYCLLYLTKKGHDASLKSLGGKKIEYDKVSYKKHILPWLNLCLREEKVVHRTSLQKAILQYRDIIEKIIGTDMNSDFEKSMFEILEKNLECAEEISRFLPKVKGEILFSFFQKVESHIGSPVSKNKLSKKMQEFLFAKGKCIEWFYHDRNKQRAKNFGLFFDIGVKGTLFYVMVASKALHYGIVNVEDHEGDLLKLVAPSKEDWKKEPEEFKGLKRRDWNSLKWYSHMYQMSGSKNKPWDLLHNPRQFKNLKNSNEFFEELESTIAKLKNESPSSVFKPLL